MKQISEISKEELNINIINNIDLDNVIRTNNMAPLEKISGNLVYQEIKDEDFEDPSLPKLLKTYQYALEYLYTKQSKLDQANKKLNIEYNQLINQSFEIEEKLKNNKQKINENKRMKKEHEKLLLTYESLVNFNMNPAQETNIIMKNIKSTYDFEFSQVSNGGIDLSSLNDNLSLKSDNHIFFMGEVIDCDGLCGGFNLSFAFLSAIEVSEVLINEISNK